MFLLSGKSEHYSSGPEPSLGKFRSLSSKFSALHRHPPVVGSGDDSGWDMYRHSFDLAKGLILCGIVLIVAVAISRFTIACWPVLWHCCSRHHFGAGRPS